MHFLRSLKCIYGNCSWIQFFVYNVICFVDLRLNLFRPWFLFVSLAWHCTRFIRLRSALLTVSAVYNDCFNILIFNYSVFPCSGIPWFIFQLRSFKQFLPFLIQFQKRFYFRRPFIFDTVDSWKRTLIILHYCLFLQWATFKMFPLFTPKQQCSKYTKSIELLQSFKVIKA